MIVPVIEHMENMNSRTSTTTTTTTRSTATTTRLLNSNLADKSTSLIINQNELSSTQNADSTISVQQPTISIPVLPVKDALIGRQRRVSLNQLEDVEMISEELKANDANNNDKNHINHQQTIIIEGGLNGLQFQLKPELSQNRHITLKVVPISTPGELKQNTNGHTTSELSNTISSEVNYLDERRSNENENSTPVNANTPSQTTTVNLSESNQSVYFMMQTPIDLLTNTIQTSPPIKLKSTSPPTSVKSFPQTNSTVQQTPLSTLTLQNIPTSPSIQTGYTSAVLPNTTTVTLSSPVSSSSSGAPKVVRDERRRANHNEVERRRRDNINKWIVELSKVIPDCSNDQSKHGQSKGGILEKTVQYLMDMKKSNQQLNDQIRIFEKFKHENELLKQQNEAIKKENQILKLKLGIETNNNSNANVSTTSLSS